MGMLILARHGRTAANAQGVLAGRSPHVGLDETGWGQVESSAARLQGVPLAAVVSSPLQRCQQTAGVLARTQLANGLDVTTEEALNECDYGDWTGRALAELAREDLWKTVQAQPSSARFPEGESILEVSHRAVAAIRAWDARLEATHGPSVVWLAVSHGDVIKAILSDALGQHLDNFQRIAVSPASLSVINYGQYRTEVRTTSSTSGPLLPEAAPSDQSAIHPDQGVVGGGS